MTTIVTLGGGGFSETEGELTPLDHVLLGLAGRRLDAGARGRGQRPAVCFVPTASGDAAGYCEKFERAYGGVAETSVLTLFNQSPWGYRDPAMLLKQDLVFVGGGSTANLLALWRLHGLPEVRPTAEIHTPPCVSALQSGVKRALSPSIAPSRVSAWTTRMMKASTSAGMKMTAVCPMPECTPWRARRW